MYSCSVSVDQFKNLVLKLNKFISLRLFPASPTDLPPLSKCHWWIPSCCKVLAILSKFAAVICIILKRVLLYRT